MSANNAVKLVALAAVWAIAAAVPAAADPTVQTLTPSRPSTPALDEQFLADLASAGIRATDVPTAGSPYQLHLNRHLGTAANARLSQSIAHVEDWRPQRSS